MNRCLIQFWEESERNWGVRPDGCSLHLDSEQLKFFLNNIYSERSKEIPNEYERVVGKESICFISDDLFERLLTDKSLRLLENEKNNLINMGEIIFKPYENI
jgi:hypothetical protein